MTWKFVMLCILCKLSIRNCLRCSRWISTKFISVLPGTWSGDWSSVCCSWGKKEGKWISPHDGATWRLWGPSPLSARQYAEWARQTAHWTRPVPHWAVHQDSRYSLTGRFLIICTRILFMMADWFVLFVCAEVTKLKMQLEVPGSAGTLTSAADRKLEEGQRVSTCSTQTHCCMWVSGLFERLKFVCVYIFLVFLQQNLRQLRLNLQRLGVDLQSGERACCRNTGGERLRHALTAADETLAKQVESSNVQCAICTFSFTCKLRFSLNYLTGCSALCVLQQLRKYWTHFANCMLNFHQCRV